MSVSCSIVCQIISLCLWYHSVGCFLWQTSNGNYSLSFGLMMILSWRECRAWPHCLPGKIATCEMPQFMQKWVLFSESCPALSLGTVGWTLVDQRASEFPSTLPPALLAIISFFLCQNPWQKFSLVFHKIGNREHMWKLPSPFQVTFMKICSAKENLRKKQSD